MKISRQDWISLGKFVAKSGKEKFGSQDDFIAAVNTGPTTVKNLIYAKGSLTDNTVEKVSDALGFENVSALLTAAGIRDIGLKDTVFSVLVKNTLTNSHITHLPSLFEDTIRLPVTDAYSDLYLSQSRRLVPNLDRLVLHKTLRQKNHDKHSKLLSVRLSAKDALDDKVAKRQLILGDPGTGKSSLLRALTLEICSGDWRNYDLALFVEARSFWANYKKNKISILRYAFDSAIEESTMSSCKKEEYYEMFQLWKDNVVLLVDGLDEIAGDSDAVSYVYNELQSGHFNWIATSRPAGLIRTPNEQRCYAIAPLTEDGIEALVGNWSNSQMESTSATLVSNNLINEILSSDTLMTLAENPFLLTALIFLKSLNLEDPLPQTRISLFEMLIEKIGHQARLKTANRAVLDNESSKRLESFSYSLFSRQNETVQLFELEDWIEAYPNDNSYFENRILPARLVTEQYYPNRKYHFLHLTLHEHFVARHMLSLPVSEMLEYRYNPVWRNAFVHYGALLKSKKLDGKFRVLVKTIFEECDAAGIHHILLADIFSACGVKDTVPWIDEDLKEYLNPGLAIWSDLQLLKNASVGKLDAQWLVKYQLEEFEEEIEFENEEYFPKSSWFFYGLQDESPFQIIAKSRSSYARNKIKEAFWGEDETMALSAVFVFGQVATNADMDRVRQELKNGGKFYNRCVCLSLVCKGNALFQEALEHNEFWLPHEEFRENMVMVVATSGHPSSYSCLAEFTKLICQYSDDINQLREPLRWLSQLGGPLAIETFDLLLDDPALCSARKLIDYYKNQSGGLPVHKLLDGLNVDEQIDQTISIISGGALNGWLPEDKVISKILEIPEEVLERNLIELGHIESSLIEQNGPSRLSKEIFRLSRKRLEADKKKNFYDDTTETLMNLCLEVFIGGEYKKAESFAFDCLNFYSKSEKIVSGAIRLIGVLKRNSECSATVERLESILFNAGLDVSQTVLESIARISPERFNLLAAHQVASFVIEDLAEEYDWLFFEKFWINGKGEKLFYKTTPMYIPLYYWRMGAGESDTFAGFIGTEMSKRHYKVRHNPYPREGDKGFILYEEEIDLDEFQRVFFGQLDKSAYLHILVPTDKDSYEELKTSYNSMEQDIINFIDNYASKLE